MTNPRPPIKQATPAEISARLAGGEQLRLIDVRESDELRAAALAGAEHYPMSAAASWIDALPREGELVIFCHHGQRSMQVAMALAQRGHVNLTNLSGGIDLWSQQVDPGVPRY
jgi:rhodanese-related sulfurtransferase